RDYLQEGAEMALSAGVQRNKIIIDPGMGFGKRIEDNFVILRDLNRLKSLGFPIVVGPSRKSFIGLTLNLPVHERIEGTAASVTAAILNGADIVRVHDVKQMSRVVKIADKIAGKN
ncbi:MAG: dihydropteroate synthase, partial [Fidelibacterota bacterium]